MSIKLADTLAPMANFPVAMAENIAFNDNENLQEKYDSEILKKSDLAEYMNRIDKCIYSQVGQKEGYSKGYLREYHRINKVVVIGNSITMHGRREADGIEWKVDDWREMAATYPNSGWVSLVRNYLAENVNPDIKVYKTNGSVWETQTNGSRNFATGISDQKYAEVKQDRSYLVENGVAEDVLTDDVDIIILQLSENMAEPTTDDDKNTFAQDFMNLYDALLEKCPKARIFQHCGLWANYNKFKAINSAMMLYKNANITPIFAPVLYEVNENYKISSFQSSVGAKILDAEGNTITTVTAAVASHPGDTGFKIMAIQTLHALFNSSGAHSYEHRPVIIPKNLYWTGEILWRKGTTMAKIKESNANILKWFLYPGEYLATFRHAPSIDAHGYLQVHITESAKQYLAIEQKVVSLNSNATYFLRRSVLSGTSLDWGPIEYSSAGSTQFTFDQWTITGTVGSKRIAEAYYTVKSDFSVSPDAWTTFGSYPFLCKIIEARAIPCSQKGQSQDYKTGTSNGIRVLSYGDSKVIALAASSSTNQNFTTGDIIYIKIIEM